MIIRETPQYLGYLAGLYEKDRAALFGHQLAETIISAGVKDVVYSEEDGSFSFEQMLVLPSGETAPVLYICVPEPRDGSVQIVARMSKLSRRAAVKTLRWYVDRHNRDRNENYCRLFMDSEICGLIIKANTATIKEKGLISALLYMNRTAREEYDILYGLAEGHVPVNLMEELRKEYEDLCSETQQEWDAYLAGTGKV